MNIGNSKLFKSFARPVLDHLHATDRLDSAEQPGTTESRAQHRTNRAKLDVSLIRIGSATKNALSITIEGRITGTGLMSDTIGHGEFEIMFNGFRFGKISIPEIKTGIWGANMAIKDQQVEILDMTRFKSFIRSVIVDEDTCFQLENGQCTTNSSSITSLCDYTIDIPIKGMMGPKVELKTMDIRGEGVTLTVTLHNASLFEMEFGMARFELRNWCGKVVAELAGALNVMRGSFDITLRGKTEVPPPERVRLIGIGVDETEETWRREVVRHFDAWLDLAPRKRRA